MHYTHRIVKTILDWRSLPEGCGMFSNDIKPLYSTFQHYKDFQVEIIYAEFKKNLSEAFVGVRGYRVRFISIDDMLEHDGAVSYAAHGLKAKTDKILLLENTAFCFFDAESSRLFISPSHQTAFLSGVELFFTEVNLSNPLWRLEALDSFSANHVGPWHRRVIQAECAQLPSSVVFNPENIHEYAVNTALFGEPGIYLWQGPPGTGKTKAIADFVVRFLDTTTKKLMICAHSNEAVARIVQTLSSVIPHRLVAWYVTKEGLQDHNSGFYQRTIIQNSYHPTGRRVHLSTCTHSHVIPADLMFDWFVLDEGAFCPEADLLVALMHFTMDRMSKLILVGDPMQLPPVLTMFKGNQKCGSLMGRCMHATRHPYITFNVSYRIGPLCAMFLEKHFYAHIRFQSFQYIRETSLLRNGSQFPEMVFIDVEDGKEEKVGFSPKNDEHGLIVKKLVATLQLNGVPQSNIVVVTPYAEQEALIKAKLRNDRDENIHVSTVHGMQGSERKFIILDTVRSVSVGFLADKHLMCVSISRQKTFLVVVGSAKLLRSIPIWDTFLAFLDGFGSVVGPAWIDTFTKT